MAKDAVNHRIKHGAAPKTKRRQVPKVSSAETLVYKFIFHPLRCDKAYGYSHIHNTDIL